MPLEMSGIHHVTAIGTDPRRNVEFYREVLGMRLVKKTVNFDDPGTYHLYYGDGEGRPGSIMTFFPWPHARRGSRGTGQVTVTAFAVPEGSLGWWRQRLDRSGVVSRDSRRRFDEETLPFLDPDGLELELVAHAGAENSPPWHEADVPEEFAVRGFHSVTLSLARHEATAELLSETMGLRAAGEQGARLRLETAAGEGMGTIVDLLAQPDLSRGRIAAGTVHHVAWRARDDAEQQAWRERLLGRGLEVTPILDRNYFKSIYFREPGGVLFEIATDPPGFAADEHLEELGSALKLPDWLEPARERIEAALPPLETAPGSSG